MRRPGVRVPWQLANRLVVLGFVLTACGSKNGPDCDAVGRVVGDLELAEKHGHLSEFMTDRERQEVHARWRRKCESDRIDASTRRCMTKATRLADAIACTSMTDRKPDGGKRIRDTLSVAWLEPVYAGGKFLTSTVVAARDGTVVVSGYFDGRARLRDTTIDSAGEEAVWIARFDHDGDPWWIRRLAGRRPVPLAPVAVTTEGSVIVGQTWRRDVDYGAGTGYLDAARAAGVPDPMVVVAIPPDGSAARGHALRLQGGAEDLAALDDGGLALATSAGDLPGSGDCAHGDFLVARLTEDRTVEWARCSDKRSRLEDVLAEGHAQVAATASAGVVACASFGGIVRWGDHQSKPQPPDDLAYSTSVFVVAFDREGKQRWVRYVHGDVSCMDLAVAPDGTVAARFDEYPSPQIVEIEGGRSANGPAIAAWGPDGTLRWLRTCAELLDLPSCTFRSIVPSTTGFAIVAGTDGEALIAEIDAATGGVHRKRAAPRLVLAGTIAAINDGYAFAANLPEKVDPGVPLPTAAGERPDAVVGVLK